MAGIYFHYPFCHNKCSYCNFFSSAGNKGRDAMAAVMAKELDIRKAYLKGETVSSIYFGGGTPSILSAEEIQLLLNACYQIFQINDDVEITLEANPEDINTEYCESLINAGINRLSLGTQSFSDVDLQYLERNHSAVSALKAIDIIRESGFSNYSLDLIYGLPTQSIHSFKKALKLINESGATHFSAYQLTVEEKTALDIMIRKGQKTEPEEELMAAQFEILQQFCEEESFEHYEISNFCKKGFRSRHNSSYWNGSSYLGIGPSAHSYNGKQRHWNISKINAYLDGIEEEKPAIESEILDIKMQEEERIMTGLRVMEGIDLISFRSDFGDVSYNTLIRQAEPLIQDKKLILKNNFLKLSRSGMLWADAIMAELFPPE